MGISAPLGVPASGLPAAGDQANAVLSGVIAAIGPTQPFAFRGPMNLEIWASYNTALTTTAASLSATVASAGTIAVGSAINSANVPAGTTVGAIAGTAVTLAIPPITLLGRTNTAEAFIRDIPDTTGLLGAAVSGPGIPAGTTVIAITTASIPANNNRGRQNGVVQISATPTAAAPANTNAWRDAFFTYARNGNAITATGADANATFTGAAIVFSGTVQVERSFDGCATWLPCNFGAGGILAQYNAGTPVSATFGEPEKQVYYRLNCLAYSSGTINYRISATGSAAESLSVVSPL